MQALFGVQTPPTPRNDLVTIFLTGIPGLNQVGTSPRASEMLRLNTAIPPSSRPHRLGVLAGDFAGFPNGRRVGDDVVDIALQAMAGATPLTPQFVRAPNNQLGDGVDQNDKEYLPGFPFLTVPHAGPRTWARNRACATRRSRAAMKKTWIVVLSAVAIGAVAAAATGTTNHRGAETQRFLGFSVSPCGVWPVGVAVEAGGSLQGAAAPGARHAAAGSRCGPDDRPGAPGRRSRRRDSGGACRGNPAAESACRAQRRLRDPGGEDARGAARRGALGVLRAEDAGSGVRLAASLPRGDCRGETSDRHAGHGRVELRDDWRCVPRAG